MAAPDAGPAGAVGVPHAGRGDGARRTPGGVGAAHRRGHGPALVRAGRRAIYVDALDVIATDQFLDHVQRISERLRGALEQVLVSPAQEVELGVATDDPGRAQASVDRCREVIRGLMPPVSGASGPDDAPDELDADPVDSPGGRMTRSEGLLRTAGGWPVLLLLAFVVQESVQKELVPDPFGNAMLTHNGALDDGPDLYKTFNARADGCIKVVLRP